MDNRLREFRARHRLTQENLANKVEVSRQTIHSIETGKMIPSLKLGLKIASKLGYPVEEIFRLKQAPIEEPQPAESQFDSRKHGYL